MVRASEISAWPRQRPRPWGVLRWTRAPLQPCHCLGKQGAGLLLRPAAGSSLVAFAGATLTPVHEAVGSTQALLYVGPLTPPFKTLQFHSDGKSAVGIQLQPKGSKPLYEIFPKSATCSIGFVPNKTELPHKPWTLAHRHRFV